MPTRILLADDHVVVRRGLRLLLEQEPDFTVIAEASDGAEALRRTSRLPYEKPSRDKPMKNYDATLSELFEGLDTQPPLVAVRSSQRPPMKRDEVVSLLSYEALAYTRPSREMDPFVLTVPRADNRPLLTQAGAGMEPTDPRPAPLKKDRPLPQRPYGEVRIRSASRSARR